MLKIKLSTFEWWLWAVVNGLIILHVSGVDMVIYVAIYLVIWHGLYNYFLWESWVELPVQVSFVYALLLIADLLLPWHLVHGAQILGTTALLLFDYCFLARTLVLMPWNRNTKLNFTVIKKVYFSKSVEGRVTA